MIIQVLKSKIHNAVVTAAQLDYVGSITIDENLMDECGLHKNEKVLVVNNDTGARIETYVIRGERASGIICLNGAAAHHFKVGHTCIIMAFTNIREDMIDEHEPRCIFPYHTHGNNRDYKNSQQICLEELEKVLEQNDEITFDDIKALALKMGRDNDEIELMAKSLLKNRGQ